MKTFNDNFIAKASNEELFPLGQSLWAVRALFCYCLIDFVSSIHVCT